MNGKSAFLSSIRSIAILVALPLPSIAQNVELPIGAVIDWWRPNATFPIPDGFAIADGSAVSDARSPINGATLPDFRGRFVKGAQDVGSIGATGGANQHSHRFDSGHVHEWARTVHNTTDGKRSWVTWLTAFTEYPEYISIWSNGIGSGGANYFPIAPYFPGNKYYYTSRPHVPQPEYTYSASSEPAFVGLLKLVKVR